MASQISITGPEEIALPAPAGRVQRIVVFMAFLVCGVVVLILGSSYFDIFPTNKNLTYNLFISAVFLVAALGLRRTERWQRYWRAAFAFFVAATGNLFPLLFRGGSDLVLGWFNLTAATSQGIAIAKVYEMVWIVIPILVLTKLSGASLGSLYLKREPWKWGLAIGALVWVNFAASAFLFFAIRFTSLGTLGAAMIWGVVFSCANGFMEELWLRGIFLKHFAPILGGWGAILVTSLVFALWHGGATYLTPVAIPFMVLNTFTLGLACAILILKTGSIWSAALLHAAADLFLFIALLANA